MTGSTEPLQRQDDDHRRACRAGAVMLLREMAGVHPVKRQKVEALIARYERK